MPKKSVKQDKSFYWIAREEAELTRAEASEKLQTISESRLEKLENGSTQILPEDVLAMEKAYTVHILPPGEENAVHWFLEGKTDTRSSNYMEDAATEIQV